MKLNKVICVVFFIAFAKANLSHAQQDYRQHQVALGESVPQITERYNITANQLIQLNPDLRSGLKAGAVLLIPKEEPKPSRSRTDFKSYTVAAKETLYSISKQFNVTVADLREANDELKSRELKEGETIRIPLHLKKEPKPQLTLAEKEKTLGKGQYLVEPKDTYYGISRKFNLTVSELKALNPDAGTLQPGMVLNVPSSNSIPSDVMPDEFVEYTVPAKMTMYSLREKTGISTDSLVSLNPELNRGLKAGMTLRIPNPDLNAAMQNTFADERITYLTDSIRNYRRQRVALMLPFSLHKVRDSISHEERLQKDRTLRIALDFYSGVKVAQDSMQKLGVRVEIVPFDSRRSAEHVKFLLDSNDFTSYSAVLGPLISQNVVAVANELKDKDIPVISPLTNSDVKLYKNVFQSRPLDNVKQGKLLSYIKQKGEGKNIVIISDNKQADLKKELLNRFPDAKVLMPNKDNYIYNTTIFSALSEENENWVILATTEKTLITVAVSSLSAKANDVDLRVFGFDYSEDAYDQVDNTQLAQIGFTYPSINRMSSDGEALSFYDAYRKKYKVEPSAYAIRGFDVGMDLFLRLASADDLYDNALESMTTRYVENSFNYVKRFLSGYYNEAIYILEYQDDLSLKEIKE